MVTIEGKLSSSEATSQPMNEVASKNAEGARDDVMEEREAVDESRVDESSSEESAVEVQEVKEVEDVQD